MCTMRRQNTPRLHRGSVSHQSPGATTLAERVMPLTPHATPEPTSGLHLPDHTGQLLSSRHLESEHGKSEQPVGALSGRPGKAVACVLRQKVRGRRHADSSQTRGQAGPEKAALAPDGLFWFLIPVPVGLDYFLPMGSRDTSLSPFLPL